LRKNKGLRRKKASLCPAKWDTSYVLLAYTSYT